MTEAKRLMDLFNIRSAIRYLKKGVALGILTGAVTWIISIILSAINGGIPLKLQTMAQFGMLSGTIIVALTISYIVYGTIAGFLVEYINNSNAGLIKWLNK